MKIAILTSGGDAPGMNAAIINLIHYGMQQNYEIYLIEDGYEGLLDNKFLVVDDENKYDEYLTQAGSFIYSSRSKRFMHDYVLAINNLKQHQIDYLIVIGGNGSYLGVQLLKSEIKTIFIPASIDNDINFSDYSLGFASATQEIVIQAEKLRSTFRSHKNIVFLEVMGRYCSDLANAASKQINPTLVLTHEHKLSVTAIVNLIDEWYKKNHYGIVIVSEYVYSNEEKQLIIERLQKKILCQVRWNVLGYSQRGALVQSYDLSIAKKMANLAIEQIVQNKSNVAICQENNELLAKSYQTLNIQESKG